MKKKLYLYDDIFQQWMECINANIHVQTARFYMKYQIAAVVLCPR
jgi:hypothetical protein